MEQLIIPDRTEWWITREDGHGANYAPYRVYHHEPQTRLNLENLRREQPEFRFEAQEITVHHTARKLDW